MQKRYWRTLGGLDAYLGQSFKNDDGTSYPANWLSLSSPEEKLAIGLQEIVEEVVEEPPTPATALELIENAKNAKLAGVVSWNGYFFPANPMFQAQITGLVLSFREGILPADSQVEVRTADNVTLMLTKAQLLELSGVLLQYVRQAYKDAWDAIDALAV
jgi:hypothetical protein